MGESSCADSWGRALKTGQPSLSIPCFAERRYGGVLDDELLMALAPADIAKALAGMAALAKNGLRYPFATYGIQQDVRAGIGVSYAGKAPRGQRPCRATCSSSAAVWPASSAHCSCWIAAGACCCWTATAKTGSAAWPGRASAACC